MRRETVIHIHHMTGNTIEFQFEWDKCLNKNPQHVNINMKAEKYRATL